MFKSKIIKKFDSKAQMYIYESVAVVLMMIAAVFFFNNLATAPVSPEIDLSYQLETYGIDALRVLDQKNKLSTNANSVADELKDLLPSNVHFRLDIDLEGSTDTSYDDGEQSGRVTASAHYIYVDLLGLVHNIQLLLWYR